MKTLASLLLIACLSAAAADSAEVSWGTMRYKEGDITSGWGVSPTSGSFHDPTHWGVLVFVK